MSRFEEVETFTDLTDLDARLEGIVAAQALERFGLYDRIPTHEAGALPDLPRLIQHDLEVAFLTYSVVREDVRGIPWSEVAWRKRLFGENMIPERPSKTYLELVWYSKRRLGLT